MLNETYQTYLFSSPYDPEELFKDYVFYPSLTDISQHMTRNLTKPIILMISHLRGIKDLMLSWVERDLSIVLSGTEYEFVKCNKNTLVDNSQELETIFFKNE